MSICETKDELLAEFYCLCGDMLMGNTNDEEIKRITKSMCLAGLSDVVKKEFSKMGDVLKEAK